MAMDISLEITGEGKATLKNTNIVFTFTPTHRPNGRLEELYMAKAQIEELIVELEDILKEEDHGY